MVTTRKRSIAAAADDDEQVNVDSQSSARTDMADNESDNNTISHDRKRQKKTTPLDQDQPAKVEQEQPMEVVKAKATKRTKKAAVIKTQVVVRRQPVRACRTKAESSKKDMVIVDAVPSSSKAVGTRTRKKKKEEEEKDPLIGHPKPALSMELWELILVEVAHFPPSQLIELALASKAMCSMVMSLPVWQNIINVSGIKPVPKRPKTPITPYQHVFNHRARICEQCYGYAYLNGPKAALPVFSVEEGRRIQMCLPCRQEYYERHPEPPPPVQSDEEEDDDDDDNQHGRRRQRGGRRRRPRLITKTRGQSMFRLQNRHMDMIPYDEARNPHYRAAAPMRLYEIHAIRTQARRIHGGDVGIEAAVARARTMAETRRRNLEIRRLRQEELRRQRREEVETRLERENLQQRTAINEVNQYIIHGRAFGFLNTIETLDEIIDLIRLREGRRAELVQRLEQEDVQVNAFRDIFARYVTHGVPDIDTAVARYVRIYGINTLSRERVNPPPQMQRQPQPLSQPPRQEQPQEESQEEQPQEEQPQEEQPQEEHSQEQPQEQPQEEQPQEEQPQDHSQEQPLEEQPQEEHSQEQPQEEQPQEEQPQEESHEEQPQEQEQQPSQEHPPQEQSQEEQQ